MDKNIKSKKILISALITAFISACYVYFAQFFAVKAIWLPFVSWSLYALSGGKRSDLFRIVFGLTAGMYIGCLTVVFSGLLTGLFGSMFALSAISFIMVFIILMSEHIKSIDMIPAYFFAYSSFFAFYFGSFGQAGSTPFTVIPEFFVLLIFGLILGISTAEIRNIIFSRKSIR